MLTTFDKYLIGRLLHTFIVFFVATYGLYMVFDLFTNVDDFQRNSAGGDRTSAETIVAIVRYYSFRVPEFFEMAGPILVVVSAIAVLGLLEKHSESHPILAAGIPAFRLLRPLLIGGGLLNLMLVLNQEFLLPGLAVELQTPRGSDSASIQKVDPVYDYSNHLMHIDGKEVIIEEQKLVNASFWLPEELSVPSCTLEAETAVFIHKNDKHPSGWLLQNLISPFDADLLTKEGATRILPRPNGKDVIVVSDVSFDQLYNRGRNLKLLSSGQLIERIRNPSTGLVPVRSQSLALHSRVTRPILSLLSIAIALPLVMRRESRSLIVNMTICTVVLGGFYIITQGSLMLGGSSMLRADFAAWFPVIFVGSASVWTAGYVQT